MRSSHPLPRKAKGAVRAPVETPVTSWNGGIVPLSVQA